MFKLTHPVVDLGLVCSNFEKSLHFYRDQLGLEVVVDVWLPAEFATVAGLAPRGFRQVRLKAGETLIKLMDIESPPPPGSGEFRAGVRWLTFIVEDVNKTVENLKARGVEFLSEPQVAPDAAGVVCARDPDGLLIEFVQV